MKSASGPLGRKFTITQGIMVALLVWGGYLAVGAVRAPGSHSVWRGLIVFACTVAFLAFWLGALAWRSRNRPSSD